MMIYSLSCDLSVHQRGGDGPFRANAHIGTDMTLG
jgi:hypothetical protein